MRFLTIFRSRSRAARAVLLGSAFVLAGAFSTAAGAVTMGTEVYTFPVGAGFGTSVDLGQAPDAHPDLSGHAWNRLRPGSPEDGTSDYTFAVSEFAFVGGSGTASDAWVYDITFQVGWNGTVNGDAPSEPLTDPLLFTLVDSRFGTTFDDSTPLDSSGFVIDGFSVNGTPVTPEYVQDDSGAQTGHPEGFVGNQVGDRWLGFFLDPSPEAIYTIRGQWALAQNPGDGGVLFPHAMFSTQPGIPPVPEPGAAALVLAGGALVLAQRRRARR